MNEESKTPDSKLIWNSFSIEEAKTYPFKLGPLEFWLERKKDEWLVSSRQQDDEYSYWIPGMNPDSAPRRPEDLIPARIIDSSGATRIRLEPSLSDKPIVVGAENQLILLPGSEALIFVTIPMLLTIYSIGNRENFMTEIPSYVLSNTWFGDPANGELCLSLKTAAVREKDNINTKPNRVCCPVKIINKSKENLPIEKLCIHSETLSIFLGESRLWTNRVEILFYGNDRISEVRIAKGQPGMDTTEKKIAAPRVEAKNGFFKRSFQFIKQITPFI